MAEIEIGIFKSGRQAYGFDDIAIVPSRRTRDPEDVDISWEIDVYRFDLPLLGAAMDGVMSPTTAIELGRLGGLGVLNLEGLWTRYEDPTSLFDEIRELDDEKATARMQQMYQEPIISELVTARIHQMKEAGITTAASVTPQRTEKLAPAILAGELDLLVIQGTVVSAEHVSKTSEPLNLKRFIREFDIPVIVGGCASYQAGLHLMRTGAVGVLVGVGPGNACTTRGVLGLGVPQATAIADVAGARMRHLDETGVYVHVIADGGMSKGGDIAKAITCGADAVMLGSPLSSAFEAPARGFHWGMATFHPTLPRGARVRTSVRGSLREILLAPAHENDGRMNLFGALRTAMATCGYETVKEFQKAEVMIAPALQTEGKALQRSQGVGMGALTDTVLVVDFGAQYARLIARRVREAHVYSEIVPASISIEEIRRRAPKGIIFSGGPKSVYESPAPSIDSAVYELGIPILGLCYGAQLMALQLGGTVPRTGQGEYGRTSLWLSPGAVSPLLPDWPSTSSVWMSHGDAITEVPPGFVATASSPAAPVAAMHDPARRLFGLQFHPEVVHTERGSEVFDHFLIDVCGCSPGWTHVSIIEHQVEAVRAQVGGERVLCALSGGVDSAVAAALVHKAVGDQLTCVFVDTGLMRAGEADQVEDTFRRQFKVDLVHVKAADRYFAALEGVTDPERKRKIIGELFIRIFEEVARDLGSGGSEDEGPRFLVQGTLYPDVIESGSDTAANIKSHHNVGGLPHDLKFELVEPLRLLFKDEVRAVGEELGLPHEIVWRQPFPGPGLAVRIIGEVTRERAEVLRAADAVVVEEIRRAGLYRELWQSFAVLPAVRTVGVMGDGRTYAYPIVIRAVTSDDAMTADWARLPYDLVERIASRVINEVEGVNRVALDVTSKPPGTIEWE